MLLRTWMLLFLLLFLTEILLSSFIKKFHWMTKRRKMDYLWARYSFYTWLQFCFYQSILNLSIFQVMYFNWTKTTYFLNAHFQQLWTETTTTKIRRIKTRIKRERIMRSLCRRKICHLLSFTGQVIQVSDLFCKTK